MHDSEAFILLPCSKRILAEVSNILFDLGEISGETIFIDGTKIEANANKYTFVWKKAVTKNQAKLLIKLADFVAECEQLYDIKIVYGNVVKIKHLKRLRKKLYALKNAENITFVHGIGKRKTPLQKSIETLEEALSKLKEYTQKIHICGERNSYSKTDSDATFMRMKEDAMGNGQLKPAFNLQQGNNCKTPLGEITKVLQVAKTFIKHRKEDLERIISDEGVLYRMNRSIQAEGSFGDIKQDMQFRRYLSKGTANVLAESTLLAIARNINKLHNKIQNGKTGTHLFPLKRFVQKKLETLIAKKILSQEILPNTTVAIDCINNELELKK